MLFSCEGAALEVLMSVYLSVRLSVVNVEIIRFQKVPVGSRRFQKVPEGYSSLHAVTVACMQ